MTIKAVLFDLDDTLLWDERSVEETFEYVCLEAEKRCGVNHAKLEQAVREEARNLYASFETFAFTQNIGINPFEGLWANFAEGDHPSFRKLQELAPYYRRESWTRGLKAQGVDDPQLGFELGELFHAERRKRPYVYDDTFTILDQLRGKYKLLLLTNGSPDLQQEKLAGVPKLAPYFDHIIISGNVGQGKPAPVIFELAMEKLGILANEGIMVGDKLTTDIQGANGVGMASVWLNRRNAARSDEIVPKFEIQSLMEIPDIIARLN